jgi:hypothetical protein
MVSILPGGSNWDIIGQHLGENVSRVLPQAVQQGYNRAQLQQSLAGIKNIANSDASPLDITLAAMQAGAGIPGSERYLGQIIPMLQQMAKAKSQGNAPLPLEGQEGIQRDRSQIESLPQKQNMPGFMGKNPQQNSSQFFPNVEGPQGGPGQAPQSATGGMKGQVLNPKQVREEGRKYAAEQTASGNFMTPQQGAEIINAENEKQKQFNELVDQERKERVESQREYGNIAENYLKDNYPEASRELTTIFQKEGEELSKQGMSEAEINRTLEGKARNIKNAIVNVEKEFDAPRIYNKMWNAAMGEYKGFDQAASDVRRHIQPLIDMGLYDTARNLLSKKGYGLEEREAILHPLSDQSRSAINQIPKIGTFTALANKGRGSALFNMLYDDKDKKNLAEALTSMKQNEPNFSLTLARKAAEDKGYSWRIFKDVLNDLESNGFELTDDQRSHRGDLDSPPLNFIQEYLHNLNLIGR